MGPREIKRGVHSVGALDWDRRLFDELIPLPDGTSYNAYVVRGSQATALLDTVDPKKTRALVENLKKLGIERIDYIIAHHGEQDHSGSIPAILEMHPGAKLVCGDKCRDVLKALLHVPDDRFRVVKDGETLSLGDRTLEFIMAPWVHWPETMLTYLREDRILFPCDLFGSHIASSDLYVTDGARVYEAAKRYYAEIMMPFRSHIRRHLEKLKTYKIDVIAPSHGPVYDRPGFITDAYADWTSDEVRPEVVLPYVSMHGSVEVMVERLVGALSERNITVKPFNLTATDVGELAIALVDASTVILGTPTVLGGAHPSAVYAAFLLNALRPKTRFVSLVCSFGWGGKAVEQVKDMLGNLKVTLLEPVVVKGLPTDEDLKRLDALADEVARMHKEQGIMKGKGERWSHGGVMPGTEGAGK